VVVKKSELQPVITETTGLRLSVVVTEVRIPAVITEATGPRLIMVLSETIIFVIKNYCYILA
jgi:hypothetical protein